MTNDSVLESKLRTALEEYQRKSDEMTGFFGSEEFKQLLKIIRKYDFIDQEDLLYGTQKVDGLPEEKFKKVFETVYHCLGSEVVRDKNSSFPEYHLDYEGIRFHLMIGQGSAYWTTKQKASSPVLE